MDKTRTSKLISLVLRHKPEVIGITLDEHGWANVADLIAGVNKIRPLTMELLEEIVRTDDKQRFSFNEDKTKIRANQGHSIPVDVELEEVEPPEYLWHGTGEKYRESIEQNGLIAKTRLYVHLSADEEMAIKVGARHGRPIVFQVSTGQMHRDGYRFFRSVNGVWLTKYVPAVYLQLLQDQPQKQAEPGNSPQLELTDRQLKICHAVIDAAAALEKQYSIDLYSNRIQIYPTVDETLARGIRQFFDLYQMSVGEKHDGLRHVTGIEDTASLIAAYKEAFSSISGGEFSVEEVVSLRKLFSEYLKDYTAQHKTRPRKLYIADPHFFHNRLCAEMDRRGFSGYEEMNDYMIRQWNTKVTHKDEVYILGDFSIAKAKATEDILKKLNGKKYLITGNHDKFLADKQFDTSMFRWIKPYEEIRDDGRRVILSHYPVFCYPGQYRKGEDGSPLTYMLYGHVHDSQDERLVHRFITETRKAQVKSRHADGPEPIPCNMINCFCMFSDYQPMTLNEWIEIDSKRREALDAEFTVSANTLAMMDAAMQNFVNGGAADPIDLDAFEEDEGSYPSVNPQDDIVILGSKNMLPESKKKLITMAQIMFKDMERDSQEEEKRTRKAKYKPRGPRQNQIDPETFARECVEQAEIPVTDSTVDLARRLSYICDEKEFVVGTLRCARSPDIQAELVEYLNSHDNPSTQDIALYVYKANGR